MSMKNSNNHIGNRTRESRAVSQPTARQVVHQALTYRTGKPVRLQSWKSPQTCFADDWTSPSRVLTVILSDSSRCDTDTWTLKM